MAQFSYAQYQNVVAQAEAAGDSVKVGFFKLKNDGDIAIARLNIASTESLKFATVHTISANGRWTKVGCLNPLGSYTDDCPLCAANKANPNGSISKSSKKVYIEMLVSYRDPSSATGYTNPIPVVWERPASFSRELANKLVIAGDLRNTLVMITRNGKAGDMQTTYSMDLLPADHPVFKPEMIPVDFSAFNNFNIARHSYWEKSVNEINTFLTTGSFPERTSDTTNSVVNSSYATTTPYVPPVQPTQPAQPMATPPAFTAGPSTPAAQPAPYGMPNTSFSAPETFPGTTGTPYTIPVSSQAATSPAQSESTPARNFTGFSF